MPASNKKPGPEEPGHPGHPPQSLGTHADDHLNQPPIAGADSFHSSAPDGALEHPALPDCDANTPNFRFSRTYSDENPSGGHQGPDSPERPSMRGICDESAQPESPRADAEDTIPGFAVPELAAHLPDGEIVADTGWKAVGRRRYRVVFCAGPQDPLLRSWIVDLMLAGGAPEIPEFPTVSEP